MPPEQKSCMSEWIITFIWCLGRPPKKLFVLIFLLTFILLLFSSFLAWCIQSRLTHWAASCHGGHLDYRPNFGADLGGTGWRSHSYMAKVEGRTKYTLIILCSCLDSILRALWGGSTPFLLLFSCISFYSDDWLKNTVFSDVKIGLFRCAKKN